jgi:hypothetical protein
MDEDLMETTVGGKKLDVSGDSCPELAERVGVLLDGFRKMATQLGEARVGKPQKKPFLITKVLVDGPFAQIGLLADLVQGGLVISFLRKNSHGGPEEPLSVSIRTLLTFTESLSQAKLPP